MPFVLIIIGLVLIVSAVQNTVTDNSQSGQKGLTTLVKGDFTGPNNFVYWAVSILVIGALGYFDAFKSLSRVFMALIVVVLFIKGQQGVNFFQSFQNVLSNLGSGLNSGSSSLASNSSSPIAQGEQALSGAQQSILNALATPQDWAQNYQVPADLGIETPLSSGRN